MSCTVMIVDDDPAIRRVLANGLARVGFCVSTADDGAPALRLAAVAPPQLVVVDFNMPTSGLEVVRKLKRRHGASMYVAVLTGEIDDLTRAVCLAAGADAVLQKPVSMNELRRRLTAAAAVIKTLPVGS